MTDSIKPQASNAKSEHGPAFYWHYAWVIVAIATVMQMVGASIRMAFGVFIDPLSQTFGWDQGAITLAYGISSVVTAVASPAAGWIGDRYGARKAMTLGGVMLIAGMLITGVVDQVWEFYLAFGVLLGIAQAIFLVPLVPGVMRWYRRHLGWGMGILMAGWGLGPALTAPLMGYLIVNLGWQGSFWATAGGSAVIVAVLIYLYRDSPSDIDTVPYGHSSRRVCQRGGAHRQSEGQGIRGLYEKDGRLLQHELDPLPRVRGPRGHTGLSGPAGRP